jgi:hypothetical protein
MWNFVSMRKLSTRHLSTLATSVDHITIGKRYGVEHWLYPAYQAICEREEPLSDGEGELLGLKDMLRISRAGQALWFTPLRECETKRGGLLDAIFGARVLDVYNAPSEPTSPEHDVNHRTIQTASTPPQWSDDLQSRSPLMPMAILKHISDNQDSAVQVCEPLVNAPILDVVQQWLKSYLSILKDAESRSEQARERLEATRASLDTQRERVDGYGSPHKVRRYELTKAEADCNKASSALNQAHVSIIATIVPCFSPLQRSYPLPLAEWEQIITALSEIQAACDARQNLGSSALEAKSHARFRQSMSPYASSAIVGTGLARADGRASICTSARQRVLPDLACAPRRPAACLLSRSRSSIHPRSGFRKRRSRPHPPSLSSLVA